jgi:hypothetical protein
MVAAWASLKGSAELAGHLGHGLGEDPDHLARSDIGLLDHLVLPGLPDETPLAGLVLHEENDDCVGHGRHADMTNIEASGGVAINLLNWITVILAPRYRVSQQPICLSLFHIEKTRLKSIPRFIQELNNPISTPLEICIIFVIPHFMARNYERKPTKYPIFRSTPDIPFHRERF